MEKHAQLGRSMVEMLGVLAVIGVLSIAAVFGYSYAMDKHRSNVIFNDVKTLVTFAVASDFVHKTTTGTTTPKDMAVDVSAPNPYIISKEAADTFYITVKNVTEGICKQLIKERPNYLEEIIPNPMGSGACEKKDTNEVDFYVNAELTQIPDGEEPEKCNETSPCSGVCSECIAGRCIDQDSKCPKSRFCINGTCEKCPEGQIQGMDGMCYGCEDEMVKLHASSIECAKCPNRISGRDSCLSCPSGTAPNASKTACTECPSGQFWSTGSGWLISVCTFCSNTIGAHTSVEECHKCDNQFATSENACYGCDNGGDRYPTTLAECKRCPNRVFISGSAMCQLCPSGTVATSNGCTGCPVGQFWNTGGGNMHNQCSTCSDIISVIASMEECHKCDKQFKVIGDGCYGCNEPRYSLNTKATLNECKRCPNRYLDSDSICRICPPGQVGNAAGTGCK